MQVGPCGMDFTKRTVATNSPPMSWQPPSVNERRCSYAAGSSVAHKTPSVKPLLVTPHALSMHAHAMGPPAYTSRQPLTHPSQSVALPPRSGALLPAAPQPATGDPLSEAKIKRVRDHMRDSRRAAVTLATTSSIAETWNRDHRPSRIKGERGERLRASCTVKGGGYSARGRPLPLASRERPMHSLRLRDAARDHARPDVAKATRVAVQACKALGCLGGRVRILQGEEEKHRLCRATASKRAVGSRVATDHCYRLCSEPQAVIASRSARHSTRCSGTHL